MIRSRCEEIDRDPAGLALSVNIWGETFAIAGSSRIDLLAGHREAGVDRVMGIVKATTRSDEALESLAADARAAGLELA